MHEFWVVCSQLRFIARPIARTCTPNIAIVIAKERSLGFAYVRRRYKGAGGQDGRGVVD